MTPHQVKKHRELIQATQDLSLEQAIEYCQQQSDNLDLNTQVKDNNYEYVRSEFRPTREVGVT